MSMVKVYLVLYNVVATIGWLYLLLLQLHYVATSTSKSTIELYGVIIFPLYVSQSIAVLEILHAITGCVKSNPVVTTSQVFSRIFIVWGVLYLVPEVHTSVSIYLFLVSWCITEIIRYSYYALSLLQCVPDFLRWLRYTLFIVLYPIGVAGELVTVYLALGPVKQNRVLTTALPNSFNMSFNYHYFMIVIMLLYLPGFPQLYCHMFAQRKKILSKEKPI